MGKLINIDNGGTLTDIWVLDGSESYHTKTITTPYDLSKCFFEGLRKVSEEIYGIEDLKALLQSTDHIRYSTTQGTNALVQRKGPSLGLLVDSPDTQWCCNDENQGDLFKALVGERIEILSLDGGGDVTGVALTEAMNRLSSSGASRIVVACSGENYVEREASLRRAILKAYPRHLLGSVPMLYTSAICRNPSANTRLWTALFNAYLHPAMERFLYTTENELALFRTRNPLLVYRNDGYSGRVAKTVALKTYSSGPRGGAEGALAYARHYGYSRVITIDVGGTTTDIGLIEQNQVAENRRGAVEGVRCNDPLAEIVSVGVGGGSIFRVRDGQLRVGPESVGGAPGPACFGMGGEEATITDALLVLGLLDPKTYFGGKLKLNLDKAVVAIEQNVAQPLALEIDEACVRMLSEWADRIVDGIRSYTAITEDSVLMAFGGGGPMGVTAVADSAGIETVLIPKLSAVFSAHGIGFSDIAHAMVDMADARDSESIRSKAAALRERVARDLKTEGYDINECETEAWIEHNDERISVPIEDLLAGQLPQGISGQIELGVRGIKRIHHAKLPARRSLEPVEAISTSVRSVKSAAGQRNSIPVYGVAEQSPGAVGEGPCVLEEDFWTCNVTPGWRFSFTENTDIVLSKNSKNNPGAES